MVIYPETVIEIKGPLCRIAWYMPEPERKGQRRVIGEVYEIQVKGVVSCGETHLTCADRSKPS